MIYNKENRGIQWRGSGMKVAAELTNTFILSDQDLDRLR